MSTPQEDPADGLSPGPDLTFASRDQLRAMAHPVRMEIVERVGRRGTARAADIAADLGIAANSVSYHLRTLARGGVIVEAPEAARDRRDRVWKLAQRDFMHAPAHDGDVDEEYLSASAATTLASIDWIRSGWISENAQRRAHHPEPEEAQAPAMLFATPMRLSREQARELYASVHEKLLEYSRLNRDPSGAELPGDPDSAGEGQDVRVLFTVLGERPHAARDADPAPSADGPAPHSGTESPSSSA